MLSNERAKDYPNFDPAITGSVAIKTNYRTDKEGRFRIAALHGRGVVTVRVEFGDRIVLALAPRPSRDDRAATSS